MVYESATPADGVPREEATSEAALEHRPLRYLLEQISRNTLFLIVGQVISKLASFGYILLLARQLSLEEFGHFNLVLSFVLIAEAAVDCGLTRLCIRDLARDQALIPRYLSVILPLKTTLAAAVWLLLTSVVWMAGHSLEIVQLTAIAGLSLLPYGLALTFDATLQARQHMPFSSLGGVVLTLTQVAAGLVVLFSGGGLALILATMLIANVLYLVFVGHGAWTRGYRFRLHLAPGFSRRLLVSALPYAAIAALGTLSARAEILTLDIFAGSDDIGLYSAAAKFPEAALFFPLMVAGAIAPVMSGFHEGAREHLRTVYLWAGRRLLLLIAPLSIGAVVLAEPVIRLLFPPQYSGAIPLFQVMFAAFPFAALQVLNAAVLLSSSDQRRTVLIFLVVVPIQFAFNFALVPMYGVLGAAAALFLGQVFTFVFSFWHLRRWYLGAGGLLRQLAHPAAAGSGMALAVFLLQGVLGYWVLLPGMAVYTGIWLLMTRQRPRSCHGAVSDCTGKS